jgi:nicotinamide phosphoribosyltransferase
MIPLTIQSDSYKVSHCNLYPQGTEVIYSYMESRGGQFDEVIMFGLQYYLKQYLSKPVIKEDVDFAEKFWAAHLGRTDCFKRENWDYIVEKYGGKLPISILAVPEGTKVGVHNVLMTIENTDPKCSWLTNWLETLLMKVYYPITIATQSHSIKQNILSHLEKSGTPESIEFKCVDFGYRGAHSEESSALGSAANLLSFSATDTVSGIYLLQQNYSADMCGFSIPATEHSTVTSYGRENELQFFSDFIDKFPTGIIACVSDSYNIFNCVTNILCRELKEKILARDGVFVCRPDSGDYMEIIPWILNEFWTYFGGTVNAKGYKVLNDKIRVIQGDGQDRKSIDALYTRIEELGWSSDNLTVGSGGGLLTKGIDRDLCKFAIKASAAKIDQIWVDIYKDPISDPGKTSKRGRFKLVKEDGKFITVPHTDERKNELVEVYRNGELLVNDTLDQIKSRL